MAVTDPLDQTTQQAKAVAQPKALTPQTPTPSPQLSGGLQLPQQQTGPGGGGTPVGDAPPATPNPLGTSDPMAFSPNPSSGYIAGTSSATSPGVVGQSFVPNSTSAATGQGNALTDLGGGMFAPTPGADVSQGIHYGSPASVLAGSAGNPTADQLQQAGLYGTSAYDPSKAGFQAIYSANGQNIFAPAGFDPAQLPANAKLIWGQGAAGPPPDVGIPSSPGMTGYGGGAIDLNAPSSNPADRGYINPLAPQPTQTGLNSVPTNPLLPAPPTTTGTTSGLSLPSGSSGSASPNAGVGLTPTDPNNPLTAQTITPDNSVNRVQQFQNSLQSTIQNVLDPAFQASLRDQNRYNFGRGLGVSGEGRTATGTIASDYNKKIADLTAQGLANANTGSIEDMYRNLGIAQQQQGFQAGQEQNAFNQAVTAQQLQDALTNSAFGRSLAQEQAGYANSPEQIALALSGIFGNQAGQAGQAAAGLFGNLGRQSGYGSGVTTGLPTSATGSTGDPSLDALLANYFAGQMDQGAQATAGQGIDQTALAKLLGVG